MKELYSCTKCGKSFVSLKIHMMHQPDEGPHRFSECGEMFDVLFKLKNHMIVHTHRKQMNVAQNVPNPLKVYFH